MKLLRFKAEKIYGYFDIDINFNEDLTILIGENGSGKTTALKLLQALIAPSFKDLFFIEFSEISLTFFNKKIESNLKCKKTKEKIIISSPDVLEDFIIDNIEISDLYYYNQNLNDNVIYKRIQEISLENRKHPIIEYIINLSSPIFLGLERKYEYDDYNNSRSINSKTFYDETYQRNIRNRRLFEGTLNSGLKDAQFLIESYYKNLRKADERNINRMKENLLLTSFKYKEFKLDKFNDKDNWKEKIQVIQKKEEVLEALAKIEGKDGKLSMELSIFFNKLDKLIKDSKKRKDNEINIELIINLIQIDKIFDLASIVQKHKEESDKMYSQINDFLKIINSFYHDSEKIIELDFIGNINVKRPNGKNCPISALSSGERQLLVIFSHAFFNKYKDSEKIFIIDEPELSLHLRWQQVFVSTLIENCSNTQFIMATHSPDIIDEYDEKIIDNWRI